MISKGKELFKKSKGMNELGILITLVAISVLIGVINPVFFNINNILNVLRSISVTAIIATGAAYVIITGGIDLSVGSFLTFGGVLCAFLSSIGINPWISLILTFIAAAMLGSVTGVLVVVLNINSFIATLAMMNVVKGIAYLISLGLPIKFNTVLNFLGDKINGVFPVPIIIMLLVMTIGHIVLKKTEYGRKLFAVGGNEKAAKLSGINTKRVKFSVYIIIAILSAFAGIITASNTSSADTAMGNDKELDTIAAAVIGGCSLSGGEGSIVGVLIGAAILGVIRNGFVLLRISTYWQMITVGVVIAIACALDQIKMMKRR
ncbi:MAG: ABC transporter permease [Eubacteriales bacterium]